MVLVLLMLCSGFLQVTSAGHLRHFIKYENTNDMKMFWDDAVEECKKNNKTLVTWYDDDDAKFTRNFTNRGIVWLGLRKNITNVTWSDGVNFNFSKSSVNLTNGEQKCVAIEGNEWKSWNCSEKKLFMCKEMAYPPTTIKKNWCQALQYCRRHGKDLVSISNQTENDAIIDKGKNGSFWIGLMRDDWQWQDNRCSTFRKWAQLPDSNNCTYHFMTTKQLTPYLCGNKRLPFCSKGSTRIKVSQNYLTWNEAYNYCKAHHTRMLTIQDKEDQDAVKDWLKNTEEGSPGPFWIGLRQSRVFGFWIWASDAFVEYDEWDNGQTPTQPYLHRCGVISNEGNYTWKDEYCLIPLRFICEEETIII